MVGRRRRRRWGGACFRPCGGEKTGRTGESTLFTTIPEFQFMKKSKIKGHSLPKTLLRKTNNVRNTAQRVGFRCSHRKLVFGRFFVASLRDKKEVSGKQKKVMN